MLTVLATLPVQPGKGPDFEKVFAELAKQVRANEKGCALYSLNRAKSDANTYVVVERYVDQDAFGHHGQTPYFLAAFPKLGAFMAGAPKIELFEEVL
ncbi:MAG TPA: putative quinol monooxygenase [Candidatus Bathyarchaeia archaeon]|nr:putative quinol monooxygenase [Candidatus Bathyarchaeia archaeon]